MTGKLLGSIVLVLGSILVTMMLVSPIRDWHWYLVMAVWFGCGARLKGMWR